ncbi:MAG TPA: hypothetical protein PKM67_01715 [Kiritimatiellia bacterium]|nr:hypothetical protein [Kiritimatiellia bacterium]
MTMRIIAAFLCLIGLTRASSAQHTLDLEAGYFFPGYNDVAIPGDSGTRLSLTDDLDADGDVVFRVRYGCTISDRHWVGFLAAPLTMESAGVLDRDTLFDDSLFPAGSPVEATFRFDSYRMIYRYIFRETDRWKICFGGALKVRDASIQLEGGGMAAEKSNTGVVPLLSFNVTWTPFEKLHLLMDGEALAAPQGRAEDVLFALQYDVSPRLALQAGYRILEGGADNDEVYTFSLFHYAVAGLVLSF